MDVTRGRKAIAGLEVGIHRRVDAGATLEGVVAAIALEYQIDRIGRIDVTTVDGVSTGAAGHRDGRGEHAGALEIAGDPNGVAGIAELDDDFLDGGVGN